ncbi:phosphotransferase [Lipingzhangella sp. LS1_29]|uniref:Phosphotransferase n=1 Tax=Lipingzhangella rawalii TaxID=2055835 RepID=A0ABU2HBN3_9ACTN|nr:phosphotransferase [Lipingzhangella rawalii]MDS1272244.1 phosphotransferase [Lipingzhangella rawalii]
MLNAALSALHSDLPDTVPEHVAATLQRPLTAITLGSRWEGRIVWAVFAERSRTPTAVLKLDTRPKYQPRLRKEHEALHQLAQIPDMADLAPAPLGLYSLGSALMLAQTAQAGVPLHVQLSRRYWRRRQSATRDHARLRSWLAALRTGTTGATTPVDPEAVQQRLAIALDRDSPGAAALQDRMAELGDEFGHLHVPTQPLHGDLDPSNCFTGRRGLSVVDWEGFTLQGPPLAEVLLFLNHYARAVPTRDAWVPDPLVGFRNGFLADGWLARLTWGTWRAELEQLGLPAEAAEYLLVATLADFATGHASTAHAHRKGSQRNWTELLTLYAAER